MAKSVVDVGKDMKIKAEDAFQALLEGRVKRAPARLTSLGALASALEQSDRPSPDQRFQRRLRSELLAAATVTEEEIFAASLEGEVDERVGSLVTVASALGSAYSETTQPDPRFRFALRNRLIDLAAHEKQQVRATTPVRRARRGLRVAVGMGAAATMLFAATVASAQGALPGDLTYSVKLAQEGASLWTVSGQAEGLRKLDFSRRRLSEVRGLTERAERQRDLYTSTLNRMDALTSDATDLILKAYKTDDLRSRAAVERLSSFAVAQASDLNSLFERLPPEVRPAARDSLGLVETTASRADAALQGCGVCPVPDVTTPTTPSIGDETSQDGPCQTCGSAGESSDPETTSGGSAGGSSDGDNPSPPKGDEVGPRPQPEKDAVDVPDVDGSNSDEMIEEEVNDLLGELGIDADDTTPLPKISIPPAPAVSLPPVNIGGLG